MLWMHRPWDHVDAGLFEDGRITDDSLEGRLREELEGAYELEQLARKLRIPVEEPFSGLMFRGAGGWLGVLGPDQDYYEQLLLDFRCTPQKKMSSAVSYGATAVLEVLKAGVREVKKVLENWGYETLEDPEEDATSAENNSSAILLLLCDGRYSLFTGDAGVPSLERAIEVADASNIDLTTCHLQQIPHHGSRRNVGPTLLDRLLGPRLAEGATRTRSAIVSAAANGAPKHPAKKVTNAYQRRGCRVVATQGDTIRHGHNAPQRPGWISATEVPFYKEVDE